MKFVRIGHISGCFGLEGAIKVRPVTENPEVFEHMDFLLLAEKDIPVRSFKILSIKNHCDGFIVTVDGVNDIKSAEALKALSVVVPEDMLPEEAADEIYWYKIDGAIVIDREKRPVGILSDYLETGSCDVFRIKLDNGDYALVSNNKDHVLEIDAENKTVTIDRAGLVFENI